MKGVIPMNEVLKTIKERRGVKEYLDKPVPKELLDQIVEAGLWAPSGRNKQPVVFLVFTKKEDIDKLREANAAFSRNGGDPFYGAPAVIVVLAKKESVDPACDGSLAMENMMLAATSLGLGTRWINRAKEVFTLASWKDCLEKLGLDPEGYVGVGNMILGYPAAVPEAPERIEGRVFYI